MGVWELKRSAGGQQVFRINKEEEYRKRQVKGNFATFLSNSKRNQIPLKRIRTVSKVMLLEVVELRDSESTLHNPTTAQACLV